jgi:DNA-directed RNA polymerase specialized sigma24 family protein
MNDITRVLSAIEVREPQAAEQLLPLVYGELRKLAAQKLAQEKPGQTLEATALVHEAYLRLMDVDQAPQWNGRGHFFGAAAEAMRRILIDNARRKQTEKHGGRKRRLHLDEALERLARKDPTAAQLVRLHCFAGLTVRQAGEAIDLSRTNAYRLWTFARAWLHSQLAEGRGAES